MKRNFVLTYCDIEVGVDYIVVLSVINSYDHLQNIFTR